MNQIQELQEVVKDMLVGINVVSAQKDEYGHWEVVFAEEKTGQQIVAEGLRHLSGNHPELIALLREEFLMLKWKRFFGEGKNNLDFYAAQALIRQNKPYMETLKLLGAE